MFTGIIEGSGTLKKIEPIGEGKRLAILTDMDLSSTKIGDSIAVNGACLTVVTLKGNLFEVDMAPETVDRTTFKHLAPGALLNLERALRLSDRLDGHLVSGHIDGTGRVLAKTVKSNAVIVTIGLPSALAREIIEKGSVAIDGISLTINRCSDSDFDVSVIPHTAKITTIGVRKVGDEVNIETDMIGKYVNSFLKRNTTDATAGTGKKTGSISMELLAKKGFL
ncbi:MAG: riboflavin synthase [Desulfobacteraceae bacterium]|nr:riboflavin synthase [Desulfobacteraceae bacterium]